MTNMGNELSVREIAELFAAASGGRSQVRFDIVDDASALGFRRAGRTVMDASKLESLGWQPAWSMEETAKKAIESMREPKR